MVVGCSFAHTRALDLDGGARLALGQAMTSHFGECEMAKTTTHPRRDSGRSPGKGQDEGQGVRELIGRVIRTLQGVPADQAADLMWELLTLAGRADVQTCLKERVLAEGAVELYYLERIQAASMRLLERLAETV